MKQDIHRFWCMFFCGGLVNAFDVEDPHQRLYEGLPAEMWVRGIGMGWDCPPLSQGLQEFTAKDFCWLFIHVIQTS